MRECWINVYGHGGSVVCGTPSSSRQWADTAAAGVHLPLVYRLHVRLKPRPGPLVIEPSAKPAGQGGQWHADRLAALMVKR